MMRSCVFGGAVKWSLVVIAVFAGAPVFGVTILVDDNGLQCPTATFTDIQSALDTAVVSDVVKVCSGIYVENVTVPDGVTLQSKSGRTSTFIEGVDTATAGAAVVTVGINTKVIDFDISCDTCTNGTLAGVGNNGPVANVAVVNNRIHDLRDTTLPMTISGEMSGIRLFDVEDVVVTNNRIHDIEQPIPFDTFRSTARGIFVSGGDAGVYRTKSEGTFVISDNRIDDLVGFRPIGINVHRMDQDVGFADLAMSGNCVSTLFDTGFPGLGGVGFEFDEVEELVDGVDAASNHADYVDIAFAVRNSTNLHIARNLVTRLKPLGPTLNLVLDAPDVPGTGHDNVFCRNTLDAGGGILVGPEVFDNKFPFGRTYVFATIPPFIFPDSPGIGGDGAVEAANIRCLASDFVCSADSNGHGNHSQCGRKPNEWPHGWHPHGGLSHSANARGVANADALAPLEHPLRGIGRE